MLASNQAQPDLFFSLGDYEKKNPDPDDDHGFRQCHVLRVKGSLKRRKVGKSQLSYRHYANSCPYHRRSTHSTEA